MQSEIAKFSSGDFEFFLHDGHNGVLHSRNLFLSEIFLSQIRNNLNFLNDAECQGNCVKSIRVLADDQIRLKELVHMVLPRAGLDEFVSLIAVGKECMICLSWFIMIVMLIAQWNSKRNLTNISVFEFSSLKMHLSDSRIEFSSRIQL